MSPTVNTVDDQVAPVIELIGEPFGGDASDDWGARPFWTDDVEIPPLFRERSLQGTNDVAPLAHRSEHGSACGLTRQTLVDASPQVPCAQDADSRPTMWFRSTWASRRPLTSAQVNHPLDQLLLNRPVDAGPALLLDLAVDTFPDLLLRCGAPPAVRDSPLHAPACQLSIDHETSCSPSPEAPRGCGGYRYPSDRPRPNRASFPIPLHVRHELAGKLLEVISTPSSLQSRREPDWCRSPWQRDRTPEYRCIESPRVGARGVPSPSPVSSM